MVCTGSRKYASDPTILERLAKPILDLALPSMLTTKEAINNIKAVLVLCTWPMPMSTLYRDPSHALAGAAVQLAVQNGLHALCHERDFAKRPTQRQNVPKNRPHFAPNIQNSMQMQDFDAEIVLRTRLWIHCLISFQRYARLRKV
jgi:hypothetical protein